MPTAPLPTVPMAKAQNAEVCPTDLPQLWPQHSSARPHFDDYLAHWADSS